MTKIPNVMTQAGSEETRYLSTKLADVGKQLRLKGNAPIQGILVDLNGVNNKATVALIKNKVESDQDEFDAIRDARNIFDYRQALALLCWS